MSLVLAEKHGACPECSTDRIIVWHDHPPKLENEQRDGKDAA